MRKHLALRSRYGLAAAVLTAAVAHAAPTTRPAPAVPGQSPEAEAVNVDLTKDMTAIYDRMTPEVMADPQKRAEVAKTLLPMIDRVGPKMDELARLDPNMKATMASLRRTMTVNRAVLDDAAAAVQLQKDAASDHADLAMQGKVDVLRVQWAQAGPGAEKQAPLVKTAVNLAKTYPDANDVTGLLLSLGQRATSVDAKNELRDTALTMDSKLAKHLKLADSGNAKLNSHVGRPLVLAGKTPDGKDFTTDGFKGKVVLVDFWAVWCGPCKAELPRVKAAYAKYHAKGLEVVGVSNDYSAKTLTTYAAENDLPWPQFFNADAAADHEWNPLTNDMGIGGIPVMLLIDKKGICRSVTARQDFEKLIPQLLEEPG